MAADLRHLAWPETSVCVVLFATSLERQERQSAAQTLGLRLGSSSEDRTPLQTAVENSTQWRQGPGFVPSLPSSE